MPESPEPMSDFFASRVDSYDTHMLENVEGCREGYLKMASLLPPGTKTLLDLGCGTGLELDAIFPLFRDLAVTGIDMTQEMLDQLERKHPHRSLRLVCASYFDAGLGDACYDAAISFQTMHHYTHSEKRGLYNRIWKALRPGGIYIECDYMVTERAEEEEMAAEAHRFRQGLPTGTFYHIDTPCTVDNQIRLLRESGFVQVVKAWRQGNTTILTANK